MDNQLTPDEIRARAANALVTMDRLFKKAEVSPSTFWRWEKEKTTPGRLTIAKLRRALEAVERAA